MRRLLVLLLLLPALFMTREAGAASPPIFCVTAFSSRVPITNLSDEQIEEFHIVDEFLMDELSTADMDLRDVSLDTSRARLDELMVNMEMGELAPVEYPDSFLDYEEGTEAFAENNRLWERLNKKLKGHNFLRLARGIQEERVLSGDYSYLMNEYKSETERAKAIADATMSDAYLLPRFRENWVRIDHSPETYVEVTLKSWTEETGGPNGDRKYDERSWTEGHTIPAKDMPCRIMDIEYELLGDTGEKIITYENSARRYFTSEKDMFKELTEEFMDDLKRVKEGKFKPKEKNATLVVGFGDISAPTLAGDEERTRALMFAIRDEAKRLDGVKIEYGAGTKTPRYLIGGNVQHCELRPTWVDPYVTVSDDLVSSTESKWYDNKGKEHKMYTKKYTQSIHDHFGHYTYTAIVAADIHLIDALRHTTVLSHRGYDADDKEIDACRHIMRDFYKKANKYLKENGKVVGG